MDFRRAGVLQMARWLVGSDGSQVAGLPVSFPEDGPTQ